MLITGDQTEFYYLVHENIELVKKIKSRIPGRTSRGGQSQNRIQRLRDEAENRYIVTIAEEAREIFEDKVTDIVLIGPAQKKDLVYEKLYYKIKDIVKNVITGTGNESRDDIMHIIQSACDSKEDSPWVDKFINDIETSGGKAIYGDEEILKSLNGGMIEVIIVKSITDDLSEKARSVGCQVIECCNPKAFIYGDIVGMKWFADHIDYGDDDIISGDVYYEEV
jgi:peptide subunit release factor 1 (eRF1)